MSRVQDLEHCFYTHEKADYYCGRVELKDKATSSVEQLLPSSDVGGGITVRIRWNLELVVLNHDVSRYLLARGDQAGPRSARVLQHRQRMVALRVQWKCPSQATGSGERPIVDIERKHRDGRRRRLRSRNAIMSSMSCNTILLRAGIAIERAFYF